DVRRIATRTGTSIANRYHHEVIPVDGMDCSDCGTVLEHSLKRIDGVLDVKASYTAQKIFVEFDSKSTNQRIIERRIKDLGYLVPKAGPQKWYLENRSLIFSLSAGITLLIGWSGEQFFSFPSELSLVLYLAAYLLAGWDTAIHAWHALRTRTFDTDLLMIAAALGAAFLGEYAEGALLLFLFSISHTLEDRILDRARGAISALADLTPKTALIQRAGNLIEIPVEQLVLGDQVVVRPGTRIPVDGHITSGSSSVNQAPVTGESLPVDKTITDMVFSGSLNGEGALEVRVTRLAKDSTLARVSQMVEQAQAGKSPTQLLTDRFMRWFVPAVLIGDLLLILVPPLFGVPFNESFARAMVLLVAASPCALALGTPAAIMAGVAQAARNGVLVKGGIYLENLGRLKAIAFDKTGTITKGELQLTDVLSTDSVNETELLALAAAIEKRSAHPIAKAIVKGAENQQLALPEVSKVEALTGSGMRAEYQAQPVWIGSTRAITQTTTNIDPEFLKHAESLAGQGKTTMAISLGDQLLGLLAVSDTIRPNIETTIGKLSDLGIVHTVMLTGDNQQAALHIANQVGVDEVRAELMPGDKVAAVKDLVDIYQETGMVGDGVNDAPALAQATVGIALGGASTDVALETADVVLMADDLSKLPFSIGLGRATRSLILQNLVIALGVTAFLMVAALSGLAGLGIAVIIHEGSTLLVALNALRLLRYT
ncbi:MAG: cadmium-translocating P-type ATPase, partial [Anaerolineales bacterium]|nr:cadmium-translocating P-type ATPase [Anaerolineales bacterium]